MSRTCGALYDAQVEIEVQPFSSFHENKDRAYMPVLSLLTRYCRENIVDGDASIPLAGMVFTNKRLLSPPPEGVAFDFLSNPTLETVEHTVLHCMAPLSLPTGEVLSDLFFEELSLMSSALDGIGFATVGSGIVRRAEEEDRPRGSERHSIILTITLFGEEQDYYCFPDEVEEGKPITWHRNTIIRPQKETN